MKANLPRCYLRLSYWSKPLLCSNIGRHQAKGGVLPYSYGDLLKLTLPHRLPAPLKPRRALNDPLRRG